MPKQRFCGKVDCRPERWPLRQQEDERACEVAHGSAGSGLRSLLFSVHQRAGVVRHPDRQRDRQLRGGDSKRKCQGAQHCDRRGKGGQEQRGRQLLLQRHQSRVLPDHRRSRRLHSAAAERHLGAHQHGGSRERTTCGRLDYAGSHRGCSSASFGGRSRRDRLQHLT